jgi:hypothetical protein
VGLVYEPRWLSGIMAAKPEVEQLDELFNSCLLMTHLNMDIAM